MFFSVVVGLMSLQYVASYRTFQAYIPNGAAVPNPCKEGQIWEGVGHILNEGTGTKNRFGLDFLDAGKEWTYDLCIKDSDLDGMTNGQELGDPKCTWKRNSGPPERTTGLTNPAICDPWDSPKCMKTPLVGSRYENQGQWLAEMCKSDKFVCPAMNETEVKTMELRMPPGSRIPPKETTYQCMVYDIYAQGVPRDQDFHMVAVTPIIDNRNVLHHAVLFGCTDDTLPTNGSYECGMLAGPTCSEFLNVWTVGLAGECYNPLAGILLGKTGHRIVALQLHWNNPDKRSDYTDTSGMTIYYTPKLRTYNAGVMMVGSALFHLPPKRAEILIQGTCSSACTNVNMNGTILVTSAWNHMHYAGNKMNIQLVRKDNSVTYLTNERVYSYDSPQVQLYPGGVEVSRGDAIVSNCGYQTMNRNKTTFWGEATSEEMCFGFLTYYPRRNMKESNCIDFIGVSYCDQASMGGCTKISSFLRRIQTTDVYRDVSSNCRQFYPCLDECVDTIVSYMKTEKCMQGSVWKYIQNEMMNGTSTDKEFLSYLYSCKTEVDLALNLTTPRPGGTVWVPGASDSDVAVTTRSGPLTILFAVLAVLARMTH
ncbi:hypothetical protein BsWGS_22073 [Bradybaena similaris]